MNRINSQETYGDEQEDFQFNTITLKINNNKDDIFNNNKDNKDNKNYIYKTDSKGENLGCNYENPNEKIPIENDNNQISNNLQEQDNTIDNQSNEKEKNNKITCLNCNNNIQNKDIAFRKCPCGCIICSEKCFQEYIQPKIKDEKSNEKLDGKIYDHLNYCSKCGFQNKKNDIKKIIIGTKDIEDSEIKDENYIKIIENHWYWKCNLCEKDESFNRRFRYYRIFCKNENNPFRNEELQHLVCFTCLNEKVKNKENKNILQCFYCEKEHIIDGFKNVNEDNIIETCCNII